MYCWKYNQDCACATSWLQSTSENPDGICSLSVSLWALVFYESVCNGNRTDKGVKILINYDSFETFIPSNFFFFPQPQNKIPTDLLLWASAIKTVTHTYPVLGSSKAILEGPLAPCGKPIPGQANSLGLYSSCAALWCPYRQRVLNWKRFARELKKS